MNTKLLAKSLAVIISLVALIKMYLYFTYKPLVASEYAGTIKEIKRNIQEYHYFKLEGETEWYPIFRTIAGQMKIGDSLVKKKGEALVHWYRDGKLKYVFNPYW